MLSLDHIALFTADLQESRAFYEMLGGKAVSKESDCFVEIVLGGLRLHIVLVDAPVDPRGRIDHLCYRVNSLDRLQQLRDQLQKTPWFLDTPLKIEMSPAKGKNLQEPAEETPPLAVMYINDPDDVTLEFRCYA